MFSVILMELNGWCAHPGSSSMGTKLFQTVKQLGHGIVHPPPSNGKVKERVALQF
jgi:hypothetical protein